MEAFCHVPYQNIQQDLSRRPEPPGSGAVRRLRFRRRTRTPSWSAPPSCWTMISPNDLLAIARAGAGVNNIPLDRCSEAGIVVFNTPGANANAVKELVLCAMLMGSRDVHGGIQWVRQQVASGVDVTTVVEKGKAAFVGPELYKQDPGRHRPGGHRRHWWPTSPLSLGMDVYGYDPFLVCGCRPAAGPPRPCGEGHQRALQAGGLYHHPHPLHQETRAHDRRRGHRRHEAGRPVHQPGPGRDLVDDDAMLAALDTGRVAAYVTDFPNNRLVGAPHVMAMPHLGASTPESEQNCAVMAVGRAAGLPGKRQHPQQRKPARRAARSAAACAGCA